MQRDHRTGPTPGTRPHLTSLAIHGSLTSFSACFGVLRRSATHDVRARTRCPDLFEDRGTGATGCLATEVKRTYKIAGSDFGRT